MTAPRQMTAAARRLLNQPHMAHLLDHPVVKAMPEPQLRALATFMEFCAAQKLGDPEAADFNAFARLHAQGVDDLEHLIRALEDLGLSEERVSAARETLDGVRHRSAFKGIPQGHHAGPERRVSVEPEDLPPDWRLTLRQLRAAAAFAPSILDRIEARLCMFAWSARESGAPVDLDSTAALQALYADMRGRSAAVNDGTPRWAYLRSTWEELRRFAAAHGLGDAVCARLASTYDVLAAHEQKQQADKFGKVLRAGTASGLLAQAETMLAEAGGLRLPQHRHAGRNAAAAIALGVGVPARPQDVHAHHVFGVGVFFEPGEGGYRFRYVPHKTRRTHPEPLNILFRPHWNRFIDALILQDQDPRYLGELRAQAIEEKRPLYMNYDGARCAHSWYSHAWSRVTGTGGHIARMLVYDEMADLGEFGIQYGAAVNHHQTQRIRAKYRSEISIRKSYAIGQGAMIGRGLDDDISDLL